MKLNEIQEDNQPSLEDLRMAEHTFWEDLNKIDSLEIDSKWGTLELRGFDQGILVTANDWMHYVEDDKPLNLNYKMDLYKNGEELFVDDDLGAKGDPIFSESFQHQIVKHSNLPMDVKREIAKSKTIHIWNTGPGKSGFYVTILTRLQSYVKKEMNEAVNRKKKPKILLTREQMEEQIIPIVENFKEVMVGQQIKTYDEKDLPRLNAHDVNIDDLDEALIIKDVRPELSQSSLGWAKEAYNRLSETVNIDILIEFEEDVNREQINKYIHDCHRFSVEIERLLINKSGLTNKSKRLIVKEGIGYHSPKIILKTKNYILHIAVPIHRSEFKSNSYNEL